MEEQNLTPPESSTEVVDIQFRPGQKVYYFDPAGLSCHPGDHVIIDTARGPEYGTVAGGNHRIPTRDVVAPLRSVLRMASAQDEKIARENADKEKRAYDICQQKIVEHGLDMQLVSAECAFDGSKILFFFTADERVDFRDLVKTLAGIFHTRIELRQIGVRDKAKMVGGLGICGRPFCCSCFLDSFQPVSIKMAKTQNLSLNLTKISGTCGRLMCCLKYEQEAYEDLLRIAPKAESFVDTPEGRGTVVEVDLLRQQVKVKMEDQPEVISTFANTEIAILRNGKAKKTDPPIPADLAPISGNGKRARITSGWEDSPVVLDSIRFRYSTETIAEETSQPAPEAPEPPREAPARSGRKRNRGKSRQDAKPADPSAGQKQAKPAPQEKKQPAPAGQKPKQKPAEKKPGETPASQPAQAAQEGKKPHRRPPHRRRKHKPQEGGKATS